MHAEKEQTVRSLTETELEQVNGGGFILAEISVVLGIAITGGIAAGIIYTDNMGTLGGRLRG
jgi:lactobin A/cerein 7B family class IIb bacteriocin